MHPRFKVLANGALVVIQFGDAVTFCARGRSYNQTDIVTLLITSSKTPDTWTDLNSSQLKIAHWVLVYRRQKAKCWCLLQP